MSATQKTWNGRTVTDGLISGGLIISLKEARKLLGSDSDGISDEYLIKLIQSFCKISGRILDNILVPNNQMV